MIKPLFILPFLCLSTYAQLPNPLLTPGTITNVPIEIVTQHGYTAKVRHVPERLKQQVFIRYFGRVPDTTGDYEVDHLISLELGGDNSISNLWPQPYYSKPFNAHIKDKLENKLAREVRATFLSKGPVVASNLLREFQAEISTNWIQAYHKHVSLTP